MKILILFALAYYSSSWAACTNGPCDDLILMSVSDKITAKRPPDMKVKEESKNEDEFIPSIKDFKENANSRSPAMMP